MYRKKQPGELKHGHADNYKPGCEECKCIARARVNAYRQKNPEAVRASHERSKQKARNAPRENVPHGLTGYRIYGCRCAVCADARREALREWRAQNPKQARKNGAAYQKKRLQDPAFRLLTNIRKRVWRVLRGEMRPARSLELVGCSLQQLRDHLSAQFAPGMSWDNYGQWHIDHRRPCASFDISDTEQLRQCFHYSNLQPLWGHDNRVKGTKI